MSFGNNLKLIRKEKGITQEQLAEMLNVSRQAVSKWESDNGYPETDKLLIIANELGVSLDYLMEQKPMESKENIVQISKKLYIVDINKKKLSAFEEFSIERLSNGIGKADLITGFTGKNTKVKVPACVLYGIKKGILGINKRTILGFYASLEDAKKELNDISNISGLDTVYELKYAAKMEGTRIVDNN